MSEYPTMDIRPDEWRRLLGPVGAGWLVTAGAALYSHTAGWPVPVKGSGPAAESIALAWWVLPALLAWVTVSWLALAGGQLVERVWLGRWVRIGRLLVRRRQARWDS